MMTPLTTQTQSNLNMPLLTIMQSFYNGKVEELEDFLYSSAYLKGKDWGEMDEIQKNEFEKEITEEFRVFSDQVILELAQQTDDDTRKKWALASKSGFKEMIVGKYPDISTLMEIVTKKYFTHLINTFLAKSNN